MDKVAPGLVLSALSEDGIVEGIEKPDAKFCLGVQWHPEWLSAADPAMQGIFDAFVAACRYALKCDFRHPRRQKITLALKWSHLYHAPVLHLDTVHFLPGWVERPLDEENAIVRRFLDTHESWIIDGNYTKTCYDRRLEEADQIIVLCFGRFCTEPVLKRAVEKPGKGALLLRAGL